MLPRRLRIAETTQRTRRPRMFPTTRTLDGTTFTHVPPLPPLPCPLNTFCADGRAFTGITPTTRRTLPTHLHLPTGSLLNVRHAARGGAFLPLRAHLPRGFGDVRYGSFCARVSAASSIDLWDGKGRKKALPFYIPFFYSLYSLPLHYLKHSRRRISPIFFPRRTCMRICMPWRGARRRRRGVVRVVYSCPYLCHALI